MTKFSVPQRGEVSANNQGIFDALEKGLGMVPNLYAVMALSETALGNYLAFQNAKTTFSNKEKQAVNLVVSQVNECLYCQSANNFHLLIEQMKTEILNPELAQSELLISYLKIFLINASRLKTGQQRDAKAAIAERKEPFILQALKTAIEENYKTKHSASDYAELLNISPKALAKITKTHLNKTLTSLISERIIIEAKRELYLTNKPVKQIAYDLGYEDEYYFSRFFKTGTDVSPQTYRDTVGFDRA